MVSKNLVAKLGLIKVRSKIENESSNLGHTFCQISQWVHVLVTYHLDA